MVEYTINKGIGRPAEFRGLIAQYLFIFVGGLLAVFVVTVVIYMIGVPQMICIGFGSMSGSVLVWATFHLNGKYGQHGLMKVQATKNHPQYISNRRRIQRLFTHIIERRKKNEEYIKNIHIGE